MWQTDLPPQNPPAIITTTVSSNSAIYGPNGTTIWIGGPLPTRTSDGTGDLINEEPFKIDWGRQIAAPPPAWPVPGVYPPNVLPVVNIPNIQPQPGMTFDELVRLVQSIQQGDFNKPPQQVEEPPAEEEAKPVEKKYGRVLEP